MSEIICGDALEKLKTLPDGIVQTCVTSPPYFGLRDYGTAAWVNGNPECDHEANIKAYLYKNYAQSAGERIGLETQMSAGRARLKGCPGCGATRQDQQIGLEDTPEAYIARLVEVFREVKRVMRDDATLWCNIGDSFANDGKWGGTTGGKHVEELHGMDIGRRRRYTGLKPKDLIGIPWMLAFALRADGWYLRSDIIWHKPNCMPESVEDRPTKAHEYIFLLSKQERYFYDADAIREPQSETTLHRFADGQAPRKPGGPKYADVDSFINAGYTTGSIGILPNGRNKRSVWTVSTMPYSHAHFATFPPKLIEPCILAGTSPRACEHCGAPWERVLSSATGGTIGKSWHDHSADLIKGNAKPTGGDIYYKTYTAPQTIGWQPTCTHDNTGSGKCIVLDPFCGAGTTPLVALEHHRQYIGIELNPEYVKLINKRIHTVQPHLWEVPA